MPFSAPLSRQPGRPASECHLLAGGSPTLLNSLYHSSKWAVEGFSESLAFELGELGIQVKLIEPGGVATDFSGRSMTLAMSPDLPDYMPGTKVAAAFQSRGSASSGRNDRSRHLRSDDRWQNQLRYLLGEDAKQSYAMREQVGDDAFIAGMRERMLG